MAVPLAGAKVRASDIPVPVALSKAATEAVTSSTTVQNDDDIVRTLAAGKSYRVALVVTVASGGAEAADIKIAWTFAGTATKTARSCFGPALAATDILDTNAEFFATALTTGVTYGIDADRATAILEELVLEDVTVAGALQMQWAQSSSSGTGTTLSTSTRCFIVPYEKV